MNQKNNLEDLPAKTAYEDLRQMALEDYARAASKDHCYNSVIPAAINEYYDRRILAEKRIREFPYLVKLVLLAVLLGYIITAAILTLV